MKYAMALGGGGARGAFEAGVWQAVKELGIEIEAITGTSVGAINGAAFVSGADVCELWANIDINDIVGLNELTDNLFSLKGIWAAVKEKLSGGFDTALLKKLLDEYISEERVRKSNIKFGLCTYSVSERKSKELFAEDIENGYLTDYIVASACFPVFKMKKIKGERFTDGGVRNNIPVNMLAERGYKNIIAVSVRGWGMKRDFECGGINIVNVQIPQECEGMMDFDNESTEKNIKRGYIALMRSFGQLGGEKYAFEKNEYEKILRLFGRDFAQRLEIAAQYLKLPDFYIYTFSKFSDLLTERALKDKKIKRIIELMEKSDSSFVKEKIDLLGSVFVTADVVMYLLKN